MLEKITSILSIESESCGSVIPPDEAMSLLGKGVESLKPFGPPPLKKLRLMYAGIPNCEYHAHASSKIEKKMGFKRVYRFLDLWWTILRKAVHIPKTEPSNVGKSEH